MIYLLHAYYLKQDVNISISKCKHIVMVHQTIPTLGFSDTISQSSFLSPFGSNIIDTR